MSTALVAELRSEDALRAAIERVREVGYRGPLDAFTPYPIEGIEDALGLKRPLITALLVPVAIVAGFFGYLLQRWCNAIAYAIDVGGHPDESAPTFIIIMFETMVLATAFAALGLFFLASQLPLLHQPLFQVDGFESATLDGFWLGIDATHPTFDHDGLVRELREMGATRFGTVTQPGVP